MEDVAKEEKPKENNEYDEGRSDDDSQPLKKKLKINNENITLENKNKIVSINCKLLESNIKQKFKTNWIDNSSYSDENLKLELFSNPFKHCIVQDFLEDPTVINELIKEMISTVNWSRKQMDLYEFYQSIDFSGINSKYLSQFFEMLKTTVMPWMEEISGIKLNKISASCSMYNYGDYLLVHDDLLGDRQIAFVFYLTPWKNVECWNTKMGGCLEIFESDSHYSPYYPVSKKIPPRNNQLIFFKVESRSYHQVGEITTFDYPRLTINGWFHGDVNSNVISQPIFPLVPMQFDQPIMDDVCLDKFISDIYLDEKIKAAIQKQIEDNSEISLQDFLHSEKYEEILIKLKSLNNDKWLLKGPANIQHYEYLCKDKIEDEELQEFFKIFHSNAFFKLLYEYTDLDLYGNNAKNPTCHIEIQRWNRGSYTILGSTSSCNDNTLECIFYLNAHENCGIITYLNSENNEKNHDRDDSDDDDDDDESYNNISNESDDAVLLTITPKNNNLSIVYRSKDTSKFTKYVSKTCKISNDDFVYIIVAGYRE